MTSRDNLSKLEVDLYNATRRFANIKNREKGKKIFFAKMEDQISNGANSTIFTLECLGDLKTNGFVRTIYSFDPYDKEDWKIKIEGQMIYDKITNKHIAHKIVGEYKDFIIKEIYGVKKGIAENHQTNCPSSNYSFNNKNRF